MMAAERRNNMTTFTHSRIWFEVEPPSKFESDAEMETYARKINLFFNRVGFTYDVLFFRELRSGCREWSFVTNTAGTYVEAPENGFWFNADFLPVGHTTKD